MNNQYRSEQIDQIMGALAKAQGSYKFLICNEDSPGGKFANLQAILNATRHSLSENGLGFYQYIELLDEGSGAALLRSTLGHSSGQYIASCARVVSGKTDRETGNRYEHQKRLHALMLLGIAPSDNDPIAFDDNGEEQLENYTIEQLKKPRDSKKIIEKNPDVVTKDQYNDLMIELEGYPEIVQNIMELYSIETLADLPKNDYHPAVQKIRRIKKTQEDYERRNK